MCTTLNAAYDITEGRPWWKVRLVAIGLTIGLAVFVLASMTLVIGGPVDRRADCRIVPVSAPRSSGPGRSLQWPLVFVLDRHGARDALLLRARCRAGLGLDHAGSVLATVLWVVISLGFKYYISNFGNYTETYGLIGGVMVLMLWFYLSGIAILVGAELNAEIEHASPYGKDVGEKVPGEKKKIGAARRARLRGAQGQGRDPVQPFPEGVNCDIESGRKPRGPQRAAERPPDRHRRLLPAAIKIGRDVKKQLEDGEPTSNVQLQLPRRTA